MSAIYTPPPQGLPRKHLPRLSFSPAQSPLGPASPAPCVWSSWSLCCTCHQPSMWRATGMEKFNFSPKSTQTWQDPGLWTGTSYRKDQVSMPSFPTYHPTYTSTAGCASAMPWAGMKTPLSYMKPESTGWRHTQKWWRPARTSLELAHVLRVKNDTSNEMNCIFQIR